MTIEETGNSKIKRFLLRKSSEWLCDEHAIGHVNALEPIVDYGKKPLKRIEAKIEDTNKSGWSTCFQRLHHESAIEYLHEHTGADCQLALLSNRKNAAPSESRADARS